MIGKRIKALREAKGWSQDELARRVKVTKPYLSMLETGVRKQPSLPALRRLAKTLGVPVTELLERSRKMPYKYSLDTGHAGDTWFRKSTYKSFHQGLVRLHALLDAWNKKEAAPPYVDEVRDLARMVAWGAERMKQLPEHGDVHVSGISVGSLRYLKAGAVLQVLDAEDQLQRDLPKIPSGVAASRRKHIAEMKELCEMGMLAQVEPADCLWEVAPSPDSRTPATVAEGERHQWDVFVCHASEDKEPFVRRLVDRLGRENVHVWYDSFELKLGDSLRRSIERGLSLSRYGVVVLSPRFFAKEWPQRELDGMAALEVDGRKVILPVWHGVGRKEVRAKSPILADRVAIRSDQGVDTVVKEILAVLDQSVDI
jgi:transcriptional regulator with XRE-family HTH domain